MFKAYASSDPSGQKADEESKNTTAASSSNDALSFFEETTTWLENQSFSAPLPNKPLVKTRPVTPPSPPPIVIATIPAREEKKAILPSTPTVFAKKSEPTK